MNEYGVVIEPRTVRFERVLPGPIERVWSYLTDSEKRGKWLASGPMELRVGGRVDLKFHNAKLSAKAEPTPERFKKFEGVQPLIGHVTQCDPPRLLSFTWGDNHEDSEVTFELTPRDANVLLVLTHRRLRDRAQMLNVSAGWHAHLSVLIDKLNGRQDGPFWSVLDQVEGEYQKRPPRTDGYVAHQTVAPHKRNQDQAEDDALK